MNKSNFKKMALMGMASGMLLASETEVHAHGTTISESTLAHQACSGKGGCGGGAQAYYQQGDSQSGFPDPSATSSETGMTEGELMSMLSPEGRAQYKTLDPEGKALALKLANQDCKGKNTCKGLNSCDTNTNTCAGLASCRGKTPGPFKDKNLAVKVAAQKMAERRAKLEGK